MKRLPFFISVLLLAVIFSSNVISMGGKKGNKQQYQCKLISRGDAISRAKGKLPGKVVGVQLSDRGDRSVYRVRILTSKKRVKTISIQACR